MAKFEAAIGRYVWLEIQGLNIACISNKPDKAFR